MSAVKLDLLKGLKEMFDEEKYAAILREEGVDGAPMNMLSVLFDDFSTESVEALGEFFFTREPEGTENDVMVFQSVITIAENISKEEKELMDKAAAILNFYIEAGSFCGSLDGETYGYRHTIMLSKDIDTEILQAMIDQNAAYAIGVSTKYADLMMKVKTGSMSLEEIEELI